jgi:hypothetical protein
MEELLHDDPLRMAIVYQEQMASLIELISQLNKDQSYDRKKIFNILWPQLELIVKDLAAGLLIGVKNDSIRCLVQKSHEDSIKKWEELDEGSNRLIANTVEEVMANRSKEVVYWNGDEDTPPKFETDPSKPQYVALSWLCELPQDENLFILLIRNKENRPFLSHEIQVIELTSKLIGWFFNYIITYDLLLFGIRQRIPDFDIKS